MADLVPSIAIVDDDLPVLKALRRLVQGQGYAVRTYESGMDFLGAVSGELPDCLIVDVQMPGMTGLELQECLRHRGVAIPTIFMTGHGGHGIEERCLGTGGAAFLEKPLQPEDLFAAIEKAVRS